MFFQDIGLLVCLNELVRPLAFACLAAVSLLDINDEVRQTIVESAKESLSLVGRLDSTSVEEMIDLAKNRGLC